MIGPYCPCITHTLLWSSSFTFNFGIQNPFTLDTKEFKQLTHFSSQRKLSPCKFSIWFHIFKINITFLLTTGSEKQFSKDGGFQQWAKVMDEWGLHSLPWLWSPMNLGGSHPDAVQYESCMLWSPYCSNRVQWPDIGPLHHSPCLTWFPADKSQKVRQRCLRYLHSIERTESKDSELCLCLCHHVKSCAEKADMLMHY